MTARFPLVSFISVALVRSLFRFQLPPVKPCMRFSRTRLTDAVHRLAFGFPRQGLAALGAITVPSRLSNPQRSADS